MNLNELRDEAYSIAKANGWHEEEYSDSHFLMLIITEIAEAVNSDRNNKRADIAKFKEIINDIPSGATLAEHNDWFRKAFENHVKNTVEDELSDIVIRCLDLAGLRDFDLKEVIELFKDIESIEEGKGFIDFCYVLSGISTCDDSTEEKIIGIIAVVLGYCGLIGIDLPFFIRTKMNYNRLRGYKHGGKKY